jgi:hypothetical protein
MPDWEAELSALLQALDVSLEREPRSDGQPAAGPPLGDAASASTGLDGLDLPALAGEIQNAQAPLAHEEISAVRREIEATLALVIHLTRAGQLDRTLRDDVVFVLHALTRPLPQPDPAVERDDWQLASAAAVLHFCRVVSRLTRPLAPEAGP